MHASANSNGARPVYYAVRVMSDDSAFAEGYDAAFLHTLEGDPHATVVDQGLLRPDSTVERVLSVPRDCPLLLYVFFTSREGRWKLQVERLHHHALSFVVGAKDVEQQREAKR